MSSFQKTTASQHIPYLFELVQKTAPVGLTKYNLKSFIVLGTCITRIYVYV